MSEFNGLNFDEIRSIKEIEHEFRIAEIEAKGEQDRQTEEVKNLNALEQARLRAEYEKQQQKDRTRGEILMRVGSWLLWLVGGCVVSATDLPERISERAHREKNKG